MSMITMSGSALIDGARRRISSSPSIRSTGSTRCSQVKSTSAATRTTMQIQYSDASVKRGRRMARMLTDLRAHRIARRLNGSRLRRALLHCCDKDDASRSGDRGHVNVDPARLAEVGRAGEVDVYVNV